LPEGVRRTSVCLSGAEQSPGRILIPNRPGKRMPGEFAGLVSPGWVPRRTWEGSHPESGRSPPGTRSSGTALLVATPQHDLVPRERSRPAGRLSRCTRWDLGHEIACAQPLQRVHGRHKVSSDPTSDPPEAPRVPPRILGWGPGPTREDLQPELGESPPGTPNSGGSCCPPGRAEHVGPALGHQSVGVSHESAFPLTPGRTGVQG
jgi:hypothetical protein